MKVEFEPIAVIRTPFTQRFGIPRQPGLVPEARGIIKFNNDPDFQHALKGLEQFTHLWIVFLFHSHGGNKWKPTIRPPRLGGKEKMGVLASRSPHRPNPIGMSVVRLDEVRVTEEGRVEIEVSGVDILDGSPVIDLKPYVPYADSVPEAGSGWIENEIERYPVEFTEEASRSLPDPEIKALLIEVLEWDPRPRSQRQRDPVMAQASIGKRFAFRFEQYDIHWEIAPGGLIRVMRILSL